MENNPRPKILVICEYYLPGYKSGGGMRTIVNMIERLCTEFDFYVVTSDHDGREDLETYKTVKVNDWNKLEDTNVFYLSKSKKNIFAILQRITEVQPHVIYLNSYFAPIAIYVLVLKRIGKIRNISVILAPCGELTKGSLEIKSLKKKIYQFVANTLKLNAKLIWKASSELEAEEIKVVSGLEDKIFIAPDLPCKNILPNFNQNQKRTKISGELRLVFMSRISRKKNLLWFLNILSLTTENIRFDIIGPIDDQIYWKNCLNTIENLPTNIQCSYLGSIPNSEVTEKLIEYDFFVLPTLSENFGHVFLEALSAGCPLITTNNTPWLKLEEKSVGWDLPLDNQKLWQDVLSKCSSMNDAEYQKLSIASRKFAVDFLADKKIEDATRKTLNYAVNQ